MYLILQIYFLNSFYEPSKGHLVQNTQTISAWIRYGDLLTFVAKFRNGRHESIINLLEDLSTYNFIKSYDLEALKDVPLNNIKCLWV